MSGYIYIASPYSDPDPRIEERRYRAAALYYIGLLGQHKISYSPIVANHRLASEYHLGKDAIFWMAHNMCMLAHASELHILQLDGWDNSVGIAAEVAFWRGARSELPMHFVNMKKAQ